MNDFESRVARFQHARRADVAPFIAMDVMSAARAHEAAGRHIVHMEIGEPGFPAPAAARAAAAALLAGQPIGYTEALGRRSLREKLAEHYLKTYNRPVSPDRIAITTGSSGGFLLAFLALFDAGARIGIAAPGYPPYRTMLEALGLVPVEIETGPASRWALDAELVEAAHRRQPLDGLLVMSPANPSGTVIGPQALSAIAQVCRANNIRMVSDEIYHGLTYGGLAAETAIAFDDDAVIVNSFSKFWCMTGWRIGWLVLPEWLVRPVERLAQNLVISVPTLSQVAAEAALDADEELQDVRAIYARNRDYLARRLPEIGLSDVLPMDGAFYAYVDVGRYTNDSVAFARAILDEAHVSCTPGLDFDRSRGARYLRLSFAGSHDSVIEGTERIGAWLAKR